MRGWRAAGLFGLIVALAAAPVDAQDVPQPQPPQRSAILTLDTDALYARTRFGKALRAATDQEAEALKAESRRIDASLETEERALTDRRAGMTQAEFRPLAEAFDKKVEALRTGQEEKSRVFAAKRDTAQQQFLQAVAPILGDYMVAQGAAAIVDKAAIVVSLGAIDITDEIIAQIDLKLGDGAATPLKPGVVPLNDGTPATP